MEQKVRRVLTKFRRGSEDYEGEIDVTNVPLATLRQIFPNPEDLIRPQKLQQNRL